MERRRLLDNVSSEKYQVLEYIKSPAAQVQADRPYIDTGIKWQQGIKFVNDVLIVRDTSTSVMFGCGISTNGNNWWGQLKGYYAIANANYITATLPGSRHIVECSYPTTSSIKVTIGGKTMNGSGTTINKTNGYRTSWVWYQHVDNTWYGLKVYNSNNELIAEFVPMLRLADNKPGLLDLYGNICPLTGTPFFVNANSGADFLYSI